MVQRNERQGKQLQSTQFIFTFTIILLQSVCQLPLPASQAIINWLITQSSSR